MIKGFMVINGKTVFDSGKEIDVINPANEEVVGIVPAATKINIVEAISAAKRSFLIWSQKTPKERAKIIHEASKNVRENFEEIAKLLTFEQGKPFNEAKGEALLAADILDYYAEESTRVRGINYWIDDNKNKSQAIYQPLGVVGAISSSNYPLVLTAFKIAPAIATGNSVIVKPSSLTPLSVVNYIKRIIESGIPDGVLNCLTGSGEEIVNYLIENPDVKKISFTGSTETGRKIMSEAGKYLKKVTLELGGNSPVLVFKDADMEKAVNECVYRSFRNMGQVCNSINRIYIEKSIYNDFIESFIESTKKLIIGDGFDPNVDLGPMVSINGIKKTQNHIKNALEKGASLKYGGKVPKKFKKGYFFEPAVITGVNHQMNIMTEETFGPVAPIMGFNSLEKGIELANESTYGLVAYVYSRDFSKAIYVSEKLQFGTVSINNVAGAELGYPYGGWKNSGIGIEVSEHAMYEYLNLKHIRIKL